MVASYLRSVAKRACAATLFGLPGQRSVRARPSKLGPRSQRSDAARAGVLINSCPAYHAAPACSIPSAPRAEQRRQHVVFRDVMPAMLPRVATHGKREG